jgi:hypothetical protein
MFERTVKTDRVIPTAFVPCIPSKLRRDDDVVFKIEDIIDEEISRDEESTELLRASKELTVELNLPVRIKRTIPAIA